MNAQTVQYGRCDASGKSANAFQSVSNKSCNTKPCSSKPAVPNQTMGVPTTPDPMSGMDDAADDLPF